MAPTNEGPGYVYILKGQGEQSGLFKIGKTSYPKTRVAGLFNSGVRFSVLRLIPCDDHNSLESAMHRRFSKVRESGEWFRLSEADVQSVCQQYPVCLPPSGAEEMSIAQVAQRLKVERSTVWRWIKAGHLSARKSGPEARSPLRIPRSEVEALAIKLGLGSEGEGAEEKQIKPTELIAA